MNYQLGQNPPAPASDALRRLWPLIRPMRVRVLLACLAMMTNTGLTLSGPALTGYAIDHFVAVQDLAGLWRCCLLMMLLYGLAGGATYLQSVWMGGVGQALLFRLRQMLFEKLQDLPLSFFQANQSGDLISRLNNDTDKINQFFSQALMQFLGGLMLMSGCAVFLLTLNPRLGLVALIPASILLVVTRLLSGWTRARSAASLAGLGHLSAETSDSLENFKVVVAFDRQDYFRARFSAANHANYQTAMAAGLTNGLFQPGYALCSQLAQMLVLLYGLKLVEAGQLSLGGLIGYLVYVVRFYDPVRQIASTFPMFQTAMAAWDRVHSILRLQSNLTVVEAREPAPAAAPRLEFRNVGFGYNLEHWVLNDVNIRLEIGRTYALVGPTGGGKSTTASLMARLYDPQQGQIFLDGRDLRSYTPAERSRKIGFILQDPFLLAGTLRENFGYANADYRDELIEEMGMQSLISNFPNGLDTELSGLSLGQQQMVAFMRAVLRRPELLILDEATANIDTVTERALSTILERLPSHTTRVVIAHRLNTIEKADQIYFINQGRVELAGNMAEAVAMLREGGRST